MENKLLSYILQMQKQSSTQSVPKLPKAQTGKTMFSFKDYGSNINTLSNDNIPRKPAFVKEFEQREAFNKQQKERELKELQEREFNNRSYISQDRSTPASRAADKQRFLEAKRQEAMANSPLAQTFGSLTPGGYNPAAGSIAASQFVKTMPLIAGTAAGATALPSIIAGLNAPIAGVAGLTGTNVINAGFAYQAAKNLPNVGRSIKTAYQNPTLSNIGNATAQTALTTLDALPFGSSVAPGVKAAIKASKESGLLSNAYKVNPFAFKPNSDAAYRMIGNEGYADALTSGVIRPPKGSGHTEAYYNKGYPLDTKLRDATGRAGYEGPYMAEVKGNKDLFVDENVASYTGPMFDDPVLYSKQNIPIDNQGVKFYKEDWLRGYKEVPRQRVPNRSSLKSYNPNRQDPVTQTVYNPETGVSVNYDVDGNVIGNSKKLTTNEVKTFNQGIETRPVNTGYTPPPPEGMAPYLVTDTDAIMSKNAQWLESPQYLKRRMAATGETAVQVKADVAKILAEGEKTKFVVEPYGNKNLEGLYTRPKKYAWFERNILGKKDTPAEISIQQGLPFERHMGALDHEIKHAMSQFATNNNYKNYPTVKVGNWFERNIHGLGTHAEYLNMAPEQQVRYLKILEDIEKSKGIPKGDIITPEQFDDWVNTRYNPYYSKGSNDDVVDLVDGIARRFGKNGRKILLDKLNKAYVIPGAVGAAGVLGTQQKAEGGPIVDPRGQWAHPGKITRIPSSNITMQGVPYPVLGVASNGQRQMMYPGKNYSFGGAEHVDEYPMMKGGGTIPQYQFAGAVSSTDSLRHQAAKMMDFEARKGSPTGAGLKNWGYHQSQMPYNMQSPNWKQPTTKDEAVNMYMQEIAPRLQHFPSAMEKGEAGDFLYNTGRDPRVYMLDQYLKSKGQSGIPNRGSYNVDTKTSAWTQQLQQSLNDEWKRNQDDIYKLPVNERRVLLNKGRDFYYQNINKKADGTPNDSYKATWKPRIWESVNDYKKGGQTEDDREMLDGVADILRRVNDVNNRKQLAKYMMNNFREEDVTFEPNQFLKSANAFKEGGEMIRRADGSYSRRGLWDNIRDNKGSGKKPTKQMLEQERKINSMQGGGQNPKIKYKVVNPDDLPHFSQWTPKPGEKEAMAASWAMDREVNEKYKDNDGMLESFLEFIDPTGISSWDDVSRSFRNPLGSNWDRAFNLFSAIPVVGKLGKGAKAASVATKPGVLKKIGNAALKGIDVITGGPAMRYFDQTMNPISRGFGAISGKAVQQIPYSGVRKVWGVGSDFNQMRRFQDGVLTPAFNQLDKFMTQPPNNPNKK